MKKRMFLFAMVSFLLAKGGNTMLELIKATDTLVEGYPKINAAIDKVGQAFIVADNAVDTANNALAVANQSLTNTQSVQEQLDQVVISGDSSVEAAQARVNADNTKTYDTLKERLDTEYTEHSERLANIENQKANTADIFYKSSAELISNTLTRLNTGKYVDIAGIGDSIMDGYYANDNNGYMEIITAALRNKFPGVSVTLNNQGVSGYTVRDSIISGKLDNVDTNNAHLYIISFGHNDLMSGLSSHYTPGYGYPLKQFAADMEYIIRRLRINHPSADIILLGETPYTSDSIESNEALAKYTNEMKILASYYNCLFIDMAPIFTANPNYDTELMHDAGHPNEAGHRLIAEELMKYFIEGVVQSPRSYECPTDSLYKQWRYSHRGWKQLSQEITGDRYALFGTGWADNQTTTPANFIDIVAKSNCIAVELELSENTRLMIARDSARWYNDYTFTRDYPVSPNKFWLTIPFDDNEDTGIHSARLHLREGSLKIHQVWALESAHDFIPCDSPILTLSSGISVVESDNSSQTKSYYIKTLQPDAAAGYSITIPFIGTGLAVDYLVRDVTTAFEVIVDGAAQPDLALHKSGSLVMDGSQLICKGLPFGEHTITLTAKSGNAIAINISGFTILDERKLSHPEMQYGIAKVGEDKIFGVPYNTIPFINVSGNNVYATNKSKIGFTLSGVEGEIATYRCEGNRIVY